jgi:hypothetical protein
LFLSLSTGVLRTFGASEGCPRIAMLAGLNCRWRLP